MTGFTQVLKSEGPKLVPFFKTLAIYFVLFIPHDRPSWFATAIKCLPILSLILFVLLHGMSLGQEYSYSRKILLGLIFGCIGDALLVWPGYFLHGAGAFGISHVFYIAAFGFKPLKMRLGAILYIMGLGLLTVFIPHLKGPLLVAIPIYVLLIGTMGWRVLANVHSLEDLWTSTKLISTLGAISFAVSDFTLAYNQFVSPVPNAQLIIMSTYYAAQFGITMSVIGSVEAKLLEKAKSKKSSGKKDTRHHKKLIKSN